MIEVRGPFLVSFPHSTGFTSFYFWNFPTGMQMQISGIDLYAQRDDIVHTIGPCVCASRGMCCLQRRGDGDWLVERHL